MKFLKCVVYDNPIQIYQTFFYIKNIIKEKEFIIETSSMFI